MRHPVVAGHDGHTVTVKSRPDGWTTWTCSCGEVYRGWRQGAM